MRRINNFVADIIILFLLSVTTFAVTVQSTSGSVPPSQTATTAITISLHEPEPQPDYTDPEAVEALVRAFFVDIPVMVQIARCESSYRQFQASGEVLRGHVDPRDTGTYQINTFYHQATAESMGLDIEDIHDNLTYAKHLYETQGTQPWNASRYCWG